MGASASISLVTDEGDGNDDDAYVNIARAGDEEGKWQDPDDSWLELETGEDEDDGRVFCVSTFTGGEDPEEEDEFVYYLDVSPRREEEPERGEEGGWWTLDPSWLDPEEEDKEEVFFLNKILSKEQEGDEADRIPNPDPRSREECSMLRDVKGEEDRKMEEKEVGKTRKRGRARKKMTCSSKERWETARKDAWLRELLSSSSEDEERTEGKKAKVEEKYTRFEESSRWIKEMTSPDQGSKTQAGTKATLMGRQRGGCQQQLSMNEMLEQIEVRMRELWKEDEEGREALAEASPPRIGERPTQVGGGRSRCRLGRVILMMNILGTFMAANGARAEEKKAAYNGLLGLLENVAMGIEEKQAEM
jgi:hypothetical protein